MSKIKKFLLLGMFSVFIFACLGAAACKEQLSDETKAEIETAYFSYAYSYDDSIYETQAIVRQYIRTFVIRFHLLANQCSDQAVISCLRHRRNG